MSEPTEDTRKAVGSNALLAVDEKVDLCLRMMVHCAFDPRCDSMRVSEVVERLGAFFPPETIGKAREFARNGLIPPPVPLDFYCS